MYKKRGKSLALMFGMALATMSVSVLMLGCSSNGTANVAGSDLETSLESYEEALDYLKVSEKDRALIDSISQLDVFLDFLDASRVFSQKADANVENFEETKEYKEYLKALGALTDFASNLSMSSNALGALVWKASWMNNNYDNNK